MGWDGEQPGMMRLPSGGVVRGRGLRKAAPPGPEPTFGVYLLGKELAAVRWESRWLRWPDFRLPSDQDQARAVFAEALARVEAGDRVEFACGGGRGRTGTALACVAVLDGVPPAEAVEYVRRNYNPHAVETPWQKRYVRRFTA